MSKYNVPPRRMLVTLAPKQKSAVRKDNGSRRSRNGSWIQVGQMMRVRYNDDHYEREGHFEMVLPLGKHPIPS